MKFKNIDEKYFAARKEFSAKHKPTTVWSVTDYWPLYAGVVNIARYIAVLDLLRSVAHIPGHIAEFGMFRGANFMFMAKVMRIIDPLGCKELFGFESFQGLTTFTPEDRSASEHGGYFAGSYEELMDLVSLYELDDEVNIFKGLIQDTLPPLLESRPELSFSLVFCDTDLYEPTKLILESLHSRLSKNGLFVLDEWNYEAYPGETTAVREFLDTHGDGYEMVHLPNTRHPTLVLRKTTA